MERFFNTEGPCWPDKHYMLPPERRLGDVLKLIQRKRYFVVHAPRQTGKTTALRALAERFTAEGKYTALLVNCEIVQTLGDDLEEPIAKVLEVLCKTASINLPEELWPPEPDARTTPRARLHNFFVDWAQLCPRPLVLFFDEIDVLQGEVLITILSQLRAGYNHVPHAFPHSVCLIGLRDVRDYRMQSKTGASESRLGIGSPFNIKARSIQLRNFTSEEVSELYEQHTTATGQSWTEGAKNLAFELTQGHPWLVNAIGHYAVGREVETRAAILGEAEVERAREAMILHRGAHLNSLYARVQEERVRKVLEPILGGTRFSLDVLDDDVQFVEDLGLVRDGPQGLEIANPIYGEIIPRAWASGLERSQGERGIGELSGPDCGALQGTKVPRCTIGS